MRTSLWVAIIVATAVSARPSALARRSGPCKNQLINKDPNAVEPIPNAFAGFDWDGFGFTSCPGTACHSFPANVTKQYTPPRLAMSEGLVGGLLIHQVDLKTSPKGTFTLADKGGSFDLGPFDVFDIIDLPVRLGEARGQEDMRVHLDCTRAGSGDNVKLTISFNRNKDTAGYSVTTDKLGSAFVGLSACTISTTQEFFPLGKELEIPTESMGRKSNAAPRHIAC
ncbi:hypothetical protein C8Q77DRAFT_1072230 [Trametes polyzona]|nr:hypothetical protein C8Q77DRAFT_1072230 [Trametes polyzona]